jgi:Carboxypeptidase regulatory-like domain
MRHESIGKREWTWFFSVTIAGLLIAAFLVPRSFAQRAGQANISGVVTDQSGAVIPDAAVAATNKATGVVSNATTNSSGQYVFPYLPAGMYTVQVKKEGFQTQVANDVVLQAEQEAGLNFAMKPGQANEQVEVQANAQAVETETAALSQTVDQRSITELPLNGRNPADLVLLTPGTTNVLASDVGQHQSYTTFPIETGATSSGGRQGSTAYFLDGAYNMDNYHLLAAPFPNPDATQEFKVIGNNFDARYGFTEGGVVSIVTRSGTNAWHGDVFEFIRNYAVNGTEYFSQSTDLLKRNQFGGSLGGPIKKDKWFIFGNYQGTRQRRSVLSGTGYVPTTAMRNGDFSAYCQTGFSSSSSALPGLCNDRDSTGTLVEHQLFVPSSNNYQGFSKSGTPLSSITSGSYYQNNFINPSTFAPASVTLANLMPTNTDKYGALTVSGWPNINDFDEETFRSDYNIGDHQKVSGRAFINYFNQPPTSINFLSTDRSWIAHWQSYAGTWTWTINPNTVNSFTGSYSRLFDHSNSGIKVNGQTICYSKLIQVKEPNTPCSIESFGAGGGYDLGGIPFNAQNFNAINRWTWGVSDSLSIVKGRHLIVAGVDVLRQYWYENTDWLGLPILSFGGGPNGQFTGSGFADFLLGDMNFFMQGGGESNEIHAWMIAPYVADQFKVKPNLTLDFGLRYEPWIGPNVTGGRIASYVPGQQSTRYPNAPTGMIFAGDRGLPSGGVPSNYKKFLDPRFGFAWQPKALSNTSIRGAIGMFANPMDYANFNHASDMAPFSPTFSFSNGGGGVGLCVPSSGACIPNTNNIAYIPFQTPWSVFAPTGGTSPFPPFAAPGNVPPSSVPITYPLDIPDGFTTKFVEGRTYTWNLSIEHQFGNAWLAKAAYVGTETDHQPIASDANYGQFFGAGNPNNGARLNPNFGQVLIVNSNGTANYQGAEFTLDRRFANGFQFNANYTFSHTIDWYSTATTAFTSGIFDPRCLKCNRANSSIDVPQALNLTFVYTTPKLRGRGLNALLGGWEVSGIWQAHSGNPTWLVSGTTTAWDDRGQDYPTYASGHSSVVTKNWRDAWIPHAGFPGGPASYLDSSEFVQTPQGQKGGIGRNPTGMFYPGWNNWDTNLSKNFNLTERLGMQLRWEMYNAFNRETFHDFDNCWCGGNNPTFGQFYDSSSTPRTMQLAVKLTF